MSSPALRPLSPAPALRRPAGLILAAIVLGLMTFVGFISGCSVIFTALFIRTPQAARYPGIAAVQIGVGLIMFLVCCFCALTVAGLFRVKRWARFSILIMGGLLAFFGALDTIFFIGFAFSSVVAAPNSPGVSPAVMRFLFLGIGGFCLLVSLIGVWWLVYFNLRRIRALFAANGAFAQPELLPDTPLPQTQLQSAPMAPGRGVMEILLTCFAVLYLIGAVPVVILAFTQFPLYFLGFIFRGVSASVLALVFTALCVGVGIGILRRIKLAWVGAIAFQIVGVISSLLILVPRNRALMASYQQEIMQRIFSRMPFPLPPQGQYPQGPGYFLSVIMGVLIAGAIIWFLLRARPLFEPKNELL